MPKSISVSEFARVLKGDGPFAAIDVREPAEYNLAHIPGVPLMPRRWLEFRMHAFVPLLSTPVVVCDDDGRRATLAAATLESMGYTDVAVLAGGANRWAADDQRTEWGMNVPSKDFGERVLLQGIPEITADELHQWQQRGDDFVLVDSRTPEEHRRMCIPGARSMPGAELGLRIWELSDGASKPIVVHCAGRTRSIIGAATLLRMGATNVYALKNGTSGWRLAGLDLETGSDRVDLPDPDAANAASAEQRAIALATGSGVQFAAVGGLDALKAQAANRNLYLFDVRTREEYGEGHIPGFTWAPGGQLVQATDSYIGVTNSLIVLACSGRVRAAMTAYWLREMGFPAVVVLQGGTGAWMAAGHGLESGAPVEAAYGASAARAAIPAVAAADLAARLDSPNRPTVLFTGGSDEFAAGHIPGSRWAPRGYLEMRLADLAPNRDAPVVVTCANADNAALAAATMLSLGYGDVSLLDGGRAAWRAAGLDLETGLTGVIATPDDVLPPTRSFADMINYLRWETDLGHKYEAN